MKNILVTHRDIFNYDSTYIGFFLVYMFPFYRSHLPYQQQFHRSLNKIMTVH